MTKTKSIYLALLAVLLSPMAANADVIEITGAGAADGRWEITLIDGTFDTLQATLMAQVWWGDQALAGLFATTLQVGAGNSGSSALGPDFAYRIDSSTTYDKAACQTFAVSINNCGTGGQLSFFRDSRTRLFTYATAARVPEPGTLALLGIGLFGMAAARRRKKV